ncbi:MAG: hypothetical protein N2712_07245 [Brevinematales bacterium]|nr:hypothetical protein [Brevinematales bacterium]
MRQFFFTFVIMCISVFAFGKSVVIFPFSNKDGRDIPSASIGVLKSIMQFAKYYPGVIVKESTFDIKGRDVREVIKTVSGYEEYILGYYTKKGDVFSYEVVIYNSQGVKLNDFIVTSADLFDIADGIMQRIFSFYSGKLVSFATLNVSINLDKMRTYTIVLNDQFLSSVSGYTNFSLKIVSKTPYSVIVRDDGTKEVIYNKSFILMDNENAEVKVERQQKIGDIKTQKTLVQDEQEKLVFKSQVLSVIRKSIEEGKIFDDIQFKVLKQDALHLDYETRLKLREMYSRSLFVTITASVLNIIPGLGSIIFGDVGGFAVCILSPYISSIVTASLEEGSFLRGIFGITTLVGYGYNLVRPFIYSSWWNERIDDLLSVGKNVSLEIETQKLSLSIKF